MWCLCAALALGARQAMVLRKSTEWQNESRLDIWTPGQHLTSSFTKPLIFPCNFHRIFQSMFPPQRPARHRKTSQDARVERGLTEGTARCCVRSWHRQPTSCEVVSKEQQFRETQTDQNLPISGSRRIEDQLDRFWENTKHSKCRCGWSAYGSTSIPFYNTIGPLCSNGAPTTRQDKSKLNQMEHIWTNKSSWFYVDFIWFLFHLFHNWFDLSAVSFPCRWSLKLESNLRLTPPKGIEGVHIVHVQTLRSSCETLACLKPGNPVETLPVEPRWSRLNPTTLDTCCRASLRHLAIEVYTVYTMYLWNKKTTQVYVCTICFDVFHDVSCTANTFDYFPLHVLTCLSLSINPSLFLSYFHLYYTYIHLQSLTHRFLSFLQFPALSTRNHPAPEGSTTINQDQAMSTFIPCSSLRFPSHCQVLGSLGPCLLFHNGCLLPLKLLSFHVHRFRRTQCGNIAAKHWCASDFRNQS